jgi:8-oxo-dGTP pyrophosphatase MutT (NUDIX family)
MRIFATGFQKQYHTASTSQRWGLAGAGVLYYCPSDNTILLLLRSKDVESSGLWGIPGGAVKSGRKDARGRDNEWVDQETEAPDFSEDELRDTAYGETSEELGHLPKHEKEEGSYKWVNDNFPYTTFFATVSPQQKIDISRKIRLNWENDDYEWFRIDFLPENVHPGVEVAVNQLLQSLKSKQMQLQLAL